MLDSGGGSVKSSLGAAAYDEQDGQNGRLTACRCFDIVFIDTKTRLANLAMEDLPKARDEATSA